MIRYYSLYEIANINIGNFIPISFRCFGIYKFSSFCYYGVVKKKNRNERMGYMINLNLKKKEALFKNVEREVLSVFYTSSTNKANKNFRFAKLDSNFNIYLPYLKDGAIKLYLYYALAANSESGESWHSLDTISKKLNATERSIGNWNNELEDMGLIFRTNSGKKSKTTFVLPLTGVAVKMSTKKINQILSELKLYDSNQYAKIFGRFKLLTKLYIKNENQDTLTEVLCAHLEKVNKCGNDEHHISTFLYDVTLVEDKEIVSKILTAEQEEKVVMVKGEEAITIGGKTFQKFDCFYINDAIKIDDAAIYDIMTQLADDIDISELPEIKI